MGEVKQGSSGSQAQLGGWKYWARLQVPVGGVAHMRDGEGWNRMEWGRMRRAEMVWGGMG